MYYKIQYLNNIFVMHVNGRLSVRDKRTYYQKQNDYCSGFTKKYLLVPHEQES